MSHFVRDNGFPNLEALAAAPTQVHVVFVNWIDMSELLKPKMEVDLEGPVHITWYLGAPRAEADVYSLASPEDTLASVGRHAQVLRAAVERRDGKKV